MIAIMDYRDRAGSLVIPAGSVVEPEEARGLDPSGLAGDHREACERLKELGRVRLAEAHAAKSPKKNHQIMYDYHRIMMVYYGLLWKEQDIRQREAVPA